MANSPSEPRVRISFLDRLAAPADPHRPLTDTVEAYRDSVMRDLRWLLNTRRTAEPAPDSQPEVQRSLYHYGLPDITSLSADSAVTRRRLARLIQECIELFEPRLSRVRVSLRENEAAPDRRLIFIVEAMLEMDPSPERITFSTVLEPSSGEIRIGAGNA